MSVYQSFCNSGAYNNLTNDRSRIGYAGSHKLLRHGLPAASLNEPFGALVVRENEIAGEEPKNQQHPDRRSLVRAYEDKAYNIVTWCLEKA
jgi:hypothetical protein